MASHAFAAWLRRLQKRESVRNDHLVTLSNCTLFS